MGGRTGWKNWINAGARLALLASGVYGCLLLLRSSDGIACSPWAVYGGTGVLCLLLWLSAGRRVLWRALFLDRGKAVGLRSRRPFSWPAPCWLQSSPCWNLSWATTGSSIS